MGNLHGHFADGTEVNYYDYPSTTAIIEFAKKAKGIDLIHNPNTKGIDLLIKNDPYGAGWEVEQYQARGDYRIHGNHHFLIDGNPPVTESTLNMSNRKFNYWINKEHLNDFGNVRYTETNAERNWYTRIDLTFKYVVLLSPELILNEKIRIVSRKKAKTIYKEDIEQWWAYPVEYCEFWEEVNGIWRLNN
jgi:hypothetical protein